MSEAETQRIAEFRHRTEGKLRGIRCPDHHQVPRVMFQGERLQEMTICLKGCCSKLMQLANEAMARPVIR